MACADVARADVARADVATDRSDQSGASCSGDHTQDRPHSGSRRKRDAPGSSVSPEKQRGTGGFLHGAAGNPQTLLALCCTCPVGLTWILYPAVVWQKLLNCWQKSLSCMVERPKVFEVMALGMKVVEGAFAALAFAV